MHTTSVFRRTKPVLRLKPDSDFIVLRGDPSDALPTEITGKVMLDVPEPMYIKTLKLCLRGRHRAEHPANPDPTGWYVTDPHKVTFYEKWIRMIPTAGSTPTAHKLNPGAHEWNFRFELPGNVAESIEGNPYYYVTWDLEASVDKDKLSKTIKETSHLRVIRTLSRNVADWLPEEMIHEHTWQNKVFYKMTLPRKNFLVGTSIPVRFSVTPLRKGVEVGDVHLKLLECRQFRETRPPKRQTWDSENAVCAVHLKGPPDGSERTVPDQDEWRGLADERHEFEVVLPLPDSLTKCKQTVDTEHIQISHKVRVDLYIKNPEGHSSMGRVHFKVRLFISPALPPNADNTVNVDEAIIEQEAQIAEDDDRPPPLYETHAQDRLLDLYSDIDPGWMMTPRTRSAATSGANTPFAHSRVGSHEDLQAMLSVTALQSRLHSLNVSPAVTRSPVFAAGMVPLSESDSPRERGESSRSAANGRGLHYDLDALSRTPSYNTAVRTPPTAPGDRSLPSYEHATSRPPSPSHNGDQEAYLEAETARNTQINAQLESPAESER
ncbi:hypothetical protein M011DRAFT_316652 [Sporormia fimetaria CBS 119925]|uniref:Arrestin C-terminal-like domain-containing protein n=1 Tax=Sporormia fimetaria CBS 119925 TaxID=1340428 RepID=A0A6A6UXT0_9PLEO|nr:hypothetical protein M011DRAFT_316652 [Sporormia fimetaria CBS 119925]